jgi:hypothetical protein
MGTDRFVGGDAKLRFKSRWFAVDDKIGPALPVLSLFEGAYEFVLGRR